jgi:hypothetical protein
MGGLAARRAAEPHDPRNLHDPREKMLGSVEVPLLYELYEGASCWTLRTPLECCGPRSSTSSCWKLSGKRTEMSGAGQQV